MASAVDFKNLISIGSGGVQVALFPDILNYLKTRYKEAYGDDIKIDNNSADGVFLYNQALLINNLLQTIKAMYNNYNINDATGQALDNLCSLGNIFRKGATKSKVRVQIHNLGSEEISLTSVLCIDKNGVEWQYDTETIILGPVSNDITSRKNIDLVCKEYGPIQCDLGDIFEINNLPNNYTVEVIQQQAAVEGTNKESDRDLRARKMTSNSPIGMTILDSLVGALLQIEGVTDAKIYNSVSSNAITTKDENTVNVHDIMIDVKYNDNNLDSQIGKTIFEKLTPGVRTTQYVQANPPAHDTGVSKSYSYVPQAFGINNDEYAVTIYWKKVNPIFEAQIVIEFDDEYRSPYFTKDFIENIIGKGIIEWANSLQIGTDLDEETIKFEAYNLDPMYTGSRDFVIESVTIDGNSSIVNPDCYYNYTSAQYSEEYHKLFIS